MKDAPDVVAVIGGTLIDGCGGAPIEDSVIIIEGKRITFVGDRSAQIPPSAKKIAVTGKFVIPGLMNASAFLADGTFVTTLIRYEGRYDEVAIEAAQLALKGGVTTVFDIWGPRDYLIKARDAINQCKAVGARIYLAGNIVGYDGPLSVDFRPQWRDAVPDVFANRMDSLWHHNVGQALTRMSPEQARQEVRKYVHSGIDFLNCAITDHRPGVLQYFVFSPRVLQVITEEARRAGLPLIGFHPMTEEALVLAVNTEVDLTLVGLNARISAETVDLIAQRQSPCGLSPYTERTLEWYRQRAQSDPYRSYESIDLNSRALLEAGAVVLMAAGGCVLSADYMNSSVWTNWTPPEQGFGLLGESHFYWLLAMQDNGMKPMAALMAATRNIARAYKVDKDLGTVERGKLADLLILDRNPLENAENYRSIHIVLKEGKTIDRDTLPTQRLITAPIPETK